MANSLTTNEELCEKYALFAAHLDRWHFTVMYWLLFMFNLFLLFLASWTFIKAQDTQESKEHTTPKKKRWIRNYILLCLACVLVSTATVIMEAFALLALEFCDGEDLMSLYWSSWMMTQVGSLIAIVGIILALLHSLRDRRHPPWALALGTPVLVIAGVLHLIHDAMRSSVKKVASRPASKDSDEGPPISQANTIRASKDGEELEASKGEFIGFTIDGGPIVKFTEATTVDLGENTELLGYCDQNRPIVAYRKDSIRLIASNESEKVAVETASLEDV